VTHVPVEGGVQVPGNPGRGLRLVMPGRYASLYSVDAAPLPLVTIGPGFSLPEGGPNGAFQWLSSDEGEIEVMAPCSRCVATLEVAAQSLARPRSLQLRDSGGRLLATRRVGVSQRKVSFPVRFDRRALYKVTTSPNREPVARIVGGSDPRSLSVSIVRPRLRLRGRGA
jgi:hypothetical protein